MYASSIVVPDIVIESGGQLPEVQIYKLYPDGMVTDPLDALKVVPAAAKVSGAEVMVRVREFEVPPPGVGLVTVIEDVPEEAMSEERMVAVS